MLPWSSSYWTNTSPNLYISGPSGCADNNIPPDNVTSGCTFLSPGAQVEVAAEAAAAYYWTLVMTQVLHIWLCKTRFMATLKHGLFNNVVMIYGVAIEILLILIFIFVPKVNSLLVGSPDFPFRYWVVFFAPWAVMGVVQEGRKYLSRKYPNNYFLVNYINW